jgi:hypothetical protein
MPQFIIRQRYTSYRDGKTYGPWQVDEVVELDTADAEWVERDSPGTLTAPEVDEVAEVAEVETDPRPSLTEQVEAEAHELHATFLAEQAAPAETEVEAAPVEAVTEQVKPAVKPVRRRRDSAS